MHAVFFCFFAAVALRSANAAVSLDGDAELNAQLPQQIFRNMGMYTPRYQVPSSLPLDPPSGCKVVLVNSLERHGARQLTSSALKRTTATLTKIRTALANVSASEIADQRLAFLKTANAQSVSDLLNPFGALQSYFSGLSTAELYPSLSSNKGSAFVRASGSDRVIFSSKYWMLGYSRAPFPSGLINDTAAVRAVPNLPEPQLIIPETDGFNNTLDVSTCPGYEDESPDPEDLAQEEYGKANLVPIVGARLQKGLLPASVTLAFNDILNLMGLCSFDTLGRATVEDGNLFLEKGKISQFCSAFEYSDWLLYGYANSAGKYFGSGYGNTYHRGRATGYLRELLARLTSTAVDLDPPTSLNTTLDADSASFPLPGPNRDPPVFADFSHDNNMSPIAAAFGLFKGANMSTAAGAEKLPHAWDFGRIAPLGGKIVWEKLVCATSSGDKEFVRVRTNGAVQVAGGPDGWCPASQRPVCIPRPTRQYPMNRQQLRRRKLNDEDSLLASGLCPLENVAKLLEWTKDGSEWDKCFT
ncbi:histidine phosphatase superfamily [Cladochytrium replicatum]|nr:histidine phosphatase superfamily [Cladochytrium replicatum]